VSANTRNIQKSQQICSQAATSTDRRGIRHTQIDRTADTLTPQAAADDNRWWVVVGRARRPGVVAHRRYNQSWELAKADGRPQRRRPAQLQLAGRGRILRMLSNHIGAGVEEQRRRVQVAPPEWVESPLVVPPLDELVD